MCLGLNAFVSSEFSRALHAGGSEYRKSERISKRRAIVQAEKNKAKIAGEG